MYYPSQTCHYHITTTPSPECRSEQADDCPAARKPRKTKIVERWLRISLLPLMTKLMRSYNMEKVCPPRAAVPYSRLHTAAVPALASQTIFSAFSFCQEPARPRSYQSLQATLLLFSLRIAPVSVLRPDNASIRLVFSCLRLEKTLAFLSGIIEGAFLLFMSTVLRYPCNESALG